MKYLFLILVSFPAFAAPESGIRDSESTVFNLVVTRSLESDAELKTGAALCIFASIKNRPMKDALIASNGKIQQKPQTLDAKTLCERYSAPGELFSVVKIANPENFHVAFWNRDSVTYKAPRQWTLMMFTTGKEINAAYGDLLNLCHEKDCTEYRMMFAQEAFAMGVRFPVTEESKKSDWNADFLAASSDHFVVSTESINFIEEPHN